MIGNDIIDLKVALKGSNRRLNRFLKKLFTIKEQQSILLSKNPLVQAWLFWSMKESAYKCYVQEYKRNFFAPKKIQCSLLNTAGKIIIGDDVYFSKSKITSNYIHTISSKTKLIENDSHLFYIKDSHYKKQHKITTKKLINAFSKITNKRVDELYILKDKYGIPKLICNNKRINYSFSTSHHGNYGGFIILK